MGFEGNVCHITPVVQYQISGGISRKFIYSYYSDRITKHSSFVLVFILLLIKLG